MLKTSPFDKHSSFHYGHLFLFIWSSSVFFHNACEILLILIIRWIAQSLKKFEKLILAGPKFRKPFRLKPVDHKQKAPTTQKF